MAFSEGLTLTGCNPTGERHCSTLASLPPWVATCGSGPHQTSPLASCHPHSLSIFPASNVPLLSFFPQNFPAGQVHCICQVERMHECGHVSKRPKQQTVENRITSADSVCPSSLNTNISSVIYSLCKCSWCKQEY